MVVLYIWGSNCPRIDESLERGTGRENPERDETQKETPAPAPGSPGFLGSIPQKMR